MPLWRRKRGSGKEATPSPTGQMLAEGWNGFRWGASLSEFKARFPQATEAAERSWATGLAQEQFCGIPMTTRYFFNRHDRLSGMAFIPEMPDRERMPPFVVNELGWPPDGDNLLWQFGAVEVKVATAGLVTSVRHLRLSD